MVKGLSVPGRSRGCPCGCPYRAARSDPSRSRFRGLFSAPDRWAAQTGRHCDDDERADDGQTDDEDIAPESDVVVDNGRLRRRIGRKRRHGGGVVPRRWIRCGVRRQGQADVPANQEREAAEPSQTDLGHCVSFAPGCFTGCDEGARRQQGPNRDASLTLTWLDPYLGARALTTVSTVPSVTS